MTGAQRAEGLEARWSRALDEYVVALEASPDGRWVAVGLGDGRLVVLDGESGETVASIAAHAHGLFRVAFSPDGGALATSGHDGRARIFEVSGLAHGALAARAEVRPGVDWVEQLAWAPSGRWLAVAAGKRLRVVDTAGSVALARDDAPSTIVDLAWRPGAPATLAASAYGGVELLELDPRDASPLRVRTLDSPGVMSTLAWRASGDVLAGGLLDGAVRFFRLGRDRPSEMRGYPTKIKAVAFDPAGRALATACGELVHLWSFRGAGPEGTAPRALEAHAGVVTALAWAPGGRVLVTGGEDGWVVIWDVNRGAPRARAVLPERVTCVAVTLDGRFALAADAAGSVAALPLTGDRAAMLGGGR